MRTELGKLLKKIRIDNDETLADMSAKLGLSQSFLSQIENGKKKPPKKLMQMFPCRYPLTEQEKEEFDAYLFEATNQKKIDLTHYSKTEKKIMLELARKITTFSDEKLKEIKKIIDDV